MSMNDIYTIIDFIVDKLEVSRSYVWFNNFDYITENDPYISIDGVVIYIVDNFSNFDCFDYNTLLPSFIVLSVPGFHCSIFLHKGIDFVKFFDFMIGYLGYDDLVRYK